MVVYFITHAEVDIEPSVRIEEWGLSVMGRRRAARIAEESWVQGLGWVVSSTERKAVETAAIVAEQAGATPTGRGELGELDRSATGYLPPDAFDETVERFFADPFENVDGWESARDAQLRIVGATRQVTADFAGDGAVVSHGGVGTLLLCDLLGVTISRSREQPGLGSYFVFDPESWSLVRPWDRLG